MSIKAQIKGLEVPSEPEDETRSLWDYDTKRDKGIQMRSKPAIACERNIYSSVWLTI